MAIVSAKFKDDYKTNLKNLSDSDFHKKFFQIPEYQRIYSWQEDQIDDYLSSIKALLNEENIDDNIYLGNIIVLDDERENGAYHILDGQQRLTTLFLSIKVLLDIYEEIMSNPDFQDYFGDEPSHKKAFTENFNRTNVESVIISFPKRNGLGARGQKRNRIKYKNEKEDKKYSHVLDNIIEEKNNFSTNYKQIKEEFDSLIFKNKNTKAEQLERLLDLKEIILERIIFNFTTTKDMSSAYSIFESLNTTGLLLTPDDIVSGKINSGAYPQLAKDYNSYCETLIEKKYNITNLLHYYVQLKSKDSNAKKDRIVKYFNSINPTEIQCLLDYFMVVEFFEENYSTLFKLIGTSFNRKQLWPIIYGMGLYNVENRKEKIYSDNEINLIKHLLMFSVYDLNILKHSPGGIYRRVINDYISEIANNGVSGLTNYNSKKMIEYFKNEENKVDKDTATKAIMDFDISIKKAFLIYYIYINNSSSTLDIDKINLEHIYPQNPSHEWIEKGWKFINEDEEEKITCSFGNLMLLNHKLNKSISNRYVTHKRSKHDEFKDDALNNSNINSIDYDKFEKDKQEYILKREAEIVDKLLEINEFKKLIS